MKQFLINSILIITVLYFFFIFDEKSTAWLVAFFGIYLIVAFVWCLFSKRNVAVDFPQTDFSVERSEKIPISIMVENRSKYFPQGVLIYLTAVNTFTGEKTRTTVKQVIPPKTKKNVSLSMEIKNCGTVRIGVKKIRVYDLTQLISLRKKVQGEMRVSVLPMTHLIPMEITKKTRDFIADAEEHSDRESGDDVSEIYQVREYTKEDSARDIHWKVSAKMDDLFVKDYGKPLGSSILILFHTNSVKHKKKNTELNIQALELVASLSMSLFEQKCIHTVAWFESERNSVQKKKIAKEKNVYELLNRLVFIQSCEEEHLEAVFEDAFRGQPFSNVIDVFMDGTMTIAKQPVTLPRKKGEIDWKSIGFSV
ncbi:MAG: DUF58 domain-containing protein [Eubacterium sp.]|nr:DUF58 domain-containing protein [Eubacterium sp.]